MDPYNDALLILAILWAIPNLILAFLGINRRIGYWLSFVALYFLPLLGLLFIFNSPRNRHNDVRLSNDGVDMRRLYN